VKSGVSAANMAKIMAAAAQESSISSAAAKRENRRRSVKNGSIEKAKTWHVSKKQNLSGSIIERKWRKRRRKGVWQCRKYNRNGVKTRNTIN